MPSCGSGVRAVAKRFNVAKDVGFTSVMPRGAPELQNMAEKVATRCGLDRSPHVGFEPVAELNAWDMDMEVKNIGVCLNERCDNLSLKPTQLVGKVSKSPLVQRAKKSCVIRQLKTELIAAAT